MAVDRTRYDFNGKVRLTKKALMKELINKFLQQNKLDSLEKLKSMEKNAGLGRIKASL